MTFMANANIKTSGRFGVIWMMPIIVIFFFGGFLQYIGLLSQTQTNWLALLLFGHVFVRSDSLKQIKYEALLFVFIVFIGLQSLSHGSPLSNTFTYIYYVACTIIAAIAGRVYASRIALAVSAKSFFNFAKIFLLIELAVVVVQRVFTDQFIGLSRAPIGYIDAIFGTMYLQSDAALAAVCELLTIASFLIQCRRGDRAIISVLSFMIVFLGNSNAAKIAIILIFVLLIIQNGYRSLYGSRYYLNILLVILAVPVALVAYSPLATLLSDFFAQALDEYYHRGAWVSAARFSPMGQVFAEGVSFFGQGALTYYNPITKEWLYNAGFSTIYSLYVDFGLVGLLLYLMYQFILVLKFTRNYIEFLIFASVFILFMILNFALTDLAFVFSYNLVLYLTYIRGKWAVRVRHQRSGALSARERGI